MRTILASLTAAALIAVASIATTSGPANAGGISFSFGNGHHGFDIELEVPVYDYDEYTWDDHVEWCEDNYHTYDEDTDTYAYAPGQRTRCIAPFD